MNDVRLTLRQAGYGLLVLSRSARVLVFTVIFPIVLLVLFGSIFNKNGGGTTTLHSGQKISLEAYFTGGILAYAIAMNAFTSLAISLTTQRENGLLKRFRGTPVPAWTFLVGLIVRSIAIIVAMSVILLAIAAVAYDVTLTPTRIAYVALFIVLGTAALAALGIALTAFTTSADSAAAIAPFGIVILSFVLRRLHPDERAPERGRRRRARLSASAPRRRDADRARSRHAAPVGRQRDQPRDLGRRRHLDRRPPLPVAAARGGGVGLLSDPHINLYVGNMNGDDHSRIATTASARRARAADPRRRARALRRPRLWRGHDGRGRG